MMKKITLRAARINAGYTQKEAAEALKISHVTLVNSEKGRTAPSVRMLDSLCDLYGVQYEDINFLPE